MAYIVMALIVPSRLLETKSRPLLAQSTIVIAPCRACVLVRVRACVHAAHELGHACVHACRFTCVDARRVRYLVLVGDRSNHERRAWRTDTLDVIPAARSATLAVAAAAAHGQTGVRRDGAGGLGMELRLTPSRWGSITERTIENETMPA